MADAPDTLPAPDRTSSTWRLIAAPRPLVLQAFVDGERPARWWGPAGFCNTFETFEPRPGGAWRFVMHGPDGTSYRNESVFDQVGPDRVVVRHLSAPPFVLTVTLEELGDRTRLGWRQAFESAEAYARLKQLVDGANEQNLDRLEAELARE